MKYSTKISFILRSAILLCCYTSAHAQVSYKENTRDIHVIIKTDTLQNAWFGGINSTTISTLDCNDDNINDLLVFDRQHGKAFVLLNLQSRYVYSPEATERLPSLSKYALTYDYDNDGKKDLFTSTRLGIKAYKNISSNNNLAFGTSAEPILTYYPPNYSNMNIGTSDIPSLTDIDNDGDMDILHFNNADGISVMWERNMSMEKYGIPDSLDFKQTDDCWGGFLEQTCSKYYFGFDCKNNFRLEHVGAGAVLALDFDNDGDKEVLLGKVDCLNLNFLDNKGSSTSAFFNKLTSSFPNIVPVNPLPYPLPFFEDVDFDGIKDLVVSMGKENIDAQTDLSKSIWWYKNSGNNQMPVLNFQSKDFLQNTMIDLGQNTHPVLYDIDGDGDQDLLVGNSTNLPNKGASIHFYSNVGTPTKATFQLIDTNYFDFAKYNYNEISILFEDLNLDAKADMIVTSKKDSNFKTELFLSNQHTLFDIANPIILGFGLQEIASLAFVNVDEDNLKDALVGKSSGELYLYKNVGTASIPSFSLTDNAFGGIEPNDYFTNTNLSISISDLNKNGKLDLVTWDDLKQIKIYEDFLTQPTPFVYYKLDNGTNSIQPNGKRIRIALGDLNNDAAPDMVLGSDNGGLQLLIANPSPNSVSSYTLEMSRFEIYPNPNKGSFNVKSKKSGMLEIKNLVGQSLYKTQIDKDEVYNVSLDLNRGIYFVCIEGGEAKKIIIE